MEKQEKFVLASEVNTERIILYYIKYPKYFLNYYSTFRVFLTSGQQIKKDPSLGQLGYLQFFYLQLT